MTEIEMLQHDHLIDLNINKEITKIEMNHCKMMKFTVYHMLIQIDDKVFKAQYDLHEGCIDIFRHDITDENNKRLCIVIDPDDIPVKDIWFTDMTSGECVGDGMFLGNFNETTDIEQLIREHLL